METRGTLRVETTAFAGIYDTHYPRVFRYLVGRIRSPQEAEELAAEVFATALESLRRGAEPRNVGSWLVGIADHLASRFWRSRVPETTLSESYPNVEEDPEELAIGRLESKILWQCLDALSEEHRKALLLRIVAGLSAREVGEIMSRSEQAVRSLQFRALAALRQQWMEAERGARLPRTTSP